MKYGGILGCEGKLLGLLSEPLRDLGFAQRVVRGWDLPGESRLSGLERVEFILNRITLAPSPEPRCL